jgi:O-antigen ligase
LFLAGANQFVYAPILRFSGTVKICLCALLLAISASAALSLNPLRSAGYVASTVLGLWISAGIWSSISVRLENALALYGVLWSVFSVYIYFVDTRIVGRLTFGMAQPNTLAIVSFGALACCLAIPNLILRIALVTLNLIIILETQGRGSLLAAAITVGAYLTLTNLHATRRTRLWAFTQLASVVCGLAVLAVYWREIVDAVSALLFIEDRYRGVGSGFTGRTDAWQEAYQLFADNPIFGVGFRVHGDYMSGVIKSAHNGYLSMLADAGVVGLTTALALIAVCSWRLLKMARQGDRTAIIGFSFILGYLFVAIFERLLINFGSATSTLMWVFLLMPHWQRPGMAVQSPYPGNLGIMTSCHAA